MNVISRQGSDPGIHESGGIRIMGDRYPDPGASQARCHANSRLSLPGEVERAGGGEEGLRHPRGGKLHHPQERLGIVQGRHHLANLPGGDDGEPYV